MPKDFKALWEFIPLDKYVKPAEPAGEMARSRLQALWTRIRNKKPAPSAQSIQAELRTVPQEILDSVSPPPSWEEASRALIPDLQAWPAREGNGPFVQVVVGPPGSGTRQILECWARAKAARVLSAPPPAQILKGGGNWGEQLAGEGADPLVLPCLEACYLRHHNGLAFMRDLLAKLGNLRHRLLVGCNSWAWAYLRDALRIETFFPTPLVLASFDGARLHQWLLEMALQSGWCAYSFRQADDGCPVLPMNNEAERTAGGQNTRECPVVEPGEERTSSFMKRMAARSRGIPLVAWAIWRYCLNMAIEQEIGEDAHKASDADAGKTIWVRPWPQIHLPRVPAEAEQGELFLLHGLLLHDGLPFDLLSLLLPGPVAETRERLQSLQRAGLVKEEDGVWRVTLLGYPSVRQSMEGEGFLVDPM